MDFCTKHSQFYSEYCVYCGNPFQVKDGSPTSTEICPDCQKRTDGRCWKHPFWTDDKKN